jgi:hypothetical protein
MGENDVNLGRNVVEFRTSHCVLYIQYGYHASQKCAVLGVHFSTPTFLKSFRVALLLQEFTLFLDISLQV